MEYAKGIEFLGDYAKRTLANLEIIEDAARLQRDDAFEVTQLANSLLAIIVFPFERSLQPDSNATWKNVLINCVKIPKGETDVDKILQNMRNAVCHSHVLFENDNYKDKNGKSRIKSVVFVSCKYKNKQPRCPHEKECDMCKLKNGSTKKPDFQLAIPVKDLRDCVKSIASEIEKAAIAANNKSSKGGV